MNKNGDFNLDWALSELRPPPPPGGLRARVLGAAATRPLETPVQDRWSRIWFHRGIRVAWAAAVILLLVGHALVALPAGALRHRAEPHLAADRGIDEPLADLLRPVRISADVQPMVGLFAASSEGPADLSIGGNPS